MVPVLGVQIALPVSMNTVGAVAVVIFAAAVWLVQPFVFVATT
jgi:hypothetical protein